MKLVLIHGRDQAGIDPVALQKVWTDALIKGLEKNKLEIPSNTEIVFPFYGDELHALIGQLKTPAPGSTSRGNPVGNEAEQFLEKFTSELYENAGLEEEQEPSGIYMTEKGLLNAPPIRGLLRTLDKKGIWGDGILRTFTFDVFAYLAFPAIAQKIHQLILPSLNGEPFVLVGHSLGSIICYRILAATNTLPAKKLITLGSPLGLKVVKERLSKPLHMPACLQEEWFNAFDPRDIVALRPLDKEHFNIDPSINNYGSCRNQTPNHHGIDAYLDDPRVAKEIYDALVNN